MKTSASMSQIQLNAALDSKDRFALQKGFSVLEVTMETPSHVTPPTWRSTYCLCGPCSKFQFVYHIPFPILKEAHPQHNRQRSGALLSCKTKGEKQISEAGQFRVSLPNQL